ncbi:hypothetical protein HCJ76_44115 [Streptomyces sp. MC1]|uniref:hypothetical protein n=1 Tax=Streptomyces sp. MC1 TaxID=295105 RepID=UPI0018CB8C10|nr:hypothetical protein [Streptomyces sp. MC1]MBG7704870.1 hypothetical protein [Streptomyces sp. MC1]
MSRNRARARARARKIRARISAYCTLALVVALTVLALLASIGSARSDAGPDDCPPTTVTLTTNGKRATAK